MSKYINVDEIDYKIICYPHYDFYTKMVYTKELDGMYALKTDIDALPAADIQEVKHGRWEEIRDAYGKLEGWIHRDCSRFSMAMENYCPKCGAKMDNNENG